MISSIRPILALSILAFVSVMSSAQAADFILKEHLGREWTNEVVRFPLPTSKNIASIKSVKDDKGMLLPAQLVQGESGKLVAFQVDLKSHESRSFTLSSGQPGKKSDLSVDDTGNFITLKNSRIAIRIRRKLQPGQGPIAEIRLPSGKQSFNSAFHGQNIRTYKVETLSKGPVFAEVLCKTTFKEGGIWNLRVRVESNEPVALVREHFDVVGGGAFTLKFNSKAFQPTHLLYRQGEGGHLGKLERYTAPLGKSSVIHTIEPWMRWWGGKRKGNWFALYKSEPLNVPPMGADDEGMGLEDESGKEKKHLYPDMLAFGALRPSLWVNPKWNGKAPQVNAMTYLKLNGNDYTLSLPLGGGERYWMLAAIDKRSSVKQLEQKQRRIAPLAQRYLIKHGDFPLDVVKDYVLEWKEDVGNYPHLFINKKNLPEIRKKLAHLKSHAKRWLSIPSYSKFNIKGPLQAYYASNDARVGKTIAKVSHTWLRQLVHEGYLDQNERVAMGVAPHHQAMLLLPTINLSDAALSATAISDKERRSLFAHIAFLGYAVNRKDYWDESRGFAANPNISTKVALFQGAIACLLPNHPMAKQWADNGLGTLYWQLKNWSDEDGGCLEAPHYAMVTFASIVGGLIMGANAGHVDYVFDERVKKIAQWFAKTSTPPDSRINNRRHLPPIGNSYHGENSTFFGILAGIWQKKDPKFAAHMQWMSEAHNAQDIGIGWSFPTMSGYKQLLLENGVKAVKPDYSSELFRDTGAVLRTHFGTPRETYLHVIAGRNHGHYDYDSGSIMLYGKGRVMCDDWGYVGHHDDHYHSMLSSPAVAKGSQMTTRALTTGPGLDYYVGDKGAWRRQIALIKDTNPEGMNGYLIRDSHFSDTNADWRLWFYANEVRVHGQGATVIGKEDVDMDVFIHEAGRLGLKSSKESQFMRCALIGDRVDKQNLTQIRLFGTLKGRGAVSYLLYPRLKNESPPRVEWFAEGRIAKINSSHGTDYAYLDAVAGSKTLALAPMTRLTRSQGQTVYLPSSTPFPRIGARSSAKNLVGDKKLSALNSAIMMHPGEKLAATAVWRSPIKGSIKVSFELLDGDAKGGNGIAYSLRLGSKVLETGEIANGGKTTLLSTGPHEVSEGDLLRLLVLPGAPVKGAKPHYYDTTYAEMIVSASSGKSWTLSKANLEGNLSGNEKGGSIADSVWWFCAGEASSFDPAGQLKTHKADKSISFKGTSAAIRIRNSTPLLSLGAAGEVVMDSRKLAALSAAHK